MDYPFESIILNNREIALSRILRDEERSITPFEESTFTFIRQWLQGQQQFVIKTSGSTGTPKSITITRSQMEASATATQKALNLQRYGNALVCLDTRYIAGKMMIVRSFVTGMRIIALDPVANPLENSWGKSIHFVAIVPYQLQAILNSGNASSLDNIETVIIGGATVPAEIVKKLESFRCRAFATYGMTETISHIALKRLNGLQKTSLYETLPGVKISIDERSCLAIECNYLSERLVTNDIVEILNPTSFRWIGRADNVINSGGVKVSTEDLEERLTSLLHALTLHENFVISSLPDEILENRIVLVLERQRLGSETEKKLIQTMKDHLPKYEVPKAIYCVFPFPQTESGKVDRVQIKNIISKQQ
jgi:o-succinylbenzoate---CoA ligase